MKKWRIFPKLVDKYECIAGSLEDSAKQLAAQGKEAVEAGVNEAKTVAEAEAEKAKQAAEASEFREDTRRD